MFLRRGEWSMTMLPADALIAACEALGERFSREILPLRTEQEIRDFQARFLGKKGEVSRLMREMSDLPVEDRKRVGEAFNRIKAAISSAVAEKLAGLNRRERAHDLARTVDVTLPGRELATGHRHLITQIREEAVAIFAELGFEVAEGPQVETDFHCFEALAIPKDHPARDAQDTFYITDDVVLRTHTSPVQIRTMLAHQPPVRIVSPGITYRRDDDATHSPMFTQIEGLYVDEGVRFSDLKGVLLHFVQRYFGKALDIRFRPSYFPFVEPGAEVDMQCAFCGPVRSDCRVCKGTGWVEIGGAGMVDPDVFAQVHYDSERYTGFAFGMGLERMAMLRHNVNDIKYYYTGDIRFLRQF
jgi:phenylalanyl-tRNA synthetase alpha chain